MEIDPIVVAYADADHPHEVMNVAMCEGNYGCEVPLMTVAQHERIVAGLEARLREAEVLLRAARDELDALPSSFGYEYTSIRPIDAFLAQTAEWVETAQERAAREYNEQMEAEHHNEMMQDAFGSYRS